MGYARSAYNFIIRPVSYALLTVPTVYLADLLTENGIDAQDTILSTAPGAAVTGVMLTGLGKLVAYSQKQVLPTEEEVTIGRHYVMGILIRRGDKEALVEIPLKKISEILFYPLTMGLGAAIGWTMLNNLSQTFDATVLAVMKGACPLSLAALLSIIGGGAFYAVKGPYHAKANILRYIDKLNRLNFADYIFKEPANEKSHTPMADIEMNNNNLAGNASQQTPQQMENEQHPAQSDASERQHLQLLFIKYFALGFKSYKINLEASHTQPLERSKEEIEETPTQAYDNDPELAAAINLSLATPKAKAFYEKTTQIVSEFFKTHKAQTPEQVAPEFHVTRRLT